MQQHYKTRQRELILSFLREHAECCFSAKEIRAGLKDGGIDLGEATVYRTLTLLVSTGSLSRYEGAKGSGATYQYATENPACEHHLHLKCRTCGTFFHLECSHFKNLWDHMAEEHGFDISRADTVLYGTCESCREAKV
ncbi:MAG: transcriptional repressor [Clostridia bacterium]|nr:transcriptional repressor [Clostridia bacterium]